MWVLTSGKLFISNEVLSLKVRLNRMWHQWVFAFLVCKPALIVQKLYITAF